MEAHLQYKSKYLLEHAIVRPVLMEHHLKYDYKSSEKKKQKNQVLWSKIKAPYFTKAGSLEQAIKGDDVTLQPNM